MERRELSKLIRAFLDGTSGKWDWDNFISIRQKDPQVEAARLECLNLPERYPPEDPHHYCDPAGLRRLEVLAQELENARPEPTKE